MAEGSPGGVGRAPARAQVLRPLHILVCAPDYSPPMSARGGVSVAVRAVVERLAARGHTVTVVAPFRLYLPLRRYDAKRSAVPPAPRAQREGSVRIFRPRHLHVPGLWRVLDPLAVIVALLGVVLRTGVPDLVHGHWLYPQGFAASVVSRWLRRPVILSVHGSDVVRLTAGAHSSMYRRAMRAAVERAARVICVSRSLADELAAFGAPRERLVVIPNGVDLERFAIRDRATCRAELTRALGYPLAPEGGAPLLLFAGNLVPLKQVDRLLRAVAALGKGEPSEPVRLAVVGDGPERERLQAVATELGLADRVTFAGWRSHAEIPTWLAAADAIVLPSASEGLPLILLEALASGTPVVASRVGGVPECVEDGVTGILVDPTTVEGLTTGLAAVLSRSWDRSTLAKAARPFGWDTIAERVESLCRSVT